MNKKTDKNPNGAGRPTKLTNDIAKRLTEMWSLSDERCLSDAEIAKSLGIPEKTLESWLAHDVQGLSGIRGRARGSVKIFYLQQLNKIGTLAVTQEDFRTAAAIYEFLLEKHYPREYGRSIKVAATTSRDWIETATEDELNQFIEENKHLLNNPSERPAENT